MRILHVLDHSAPLQSGYVFRTLSILREQRRRGWETVHLTSPKQGVSKSDVETVEGFTFHRTNSESSLLKTPAIGEIALMYALSRRLDEVIVETRPDILHAHSPVLNALPTLWAGRRHKLPVVYEIRAFWEDAAVSHGTQTVKGLRYAATRALETFAIRQADAVTTICEGLRNDILGRGVPAAKVAVIPNAVDLNEFRGKILRDAALASQLGLENSDNLGFVGSFYFYEGLHLLIEAMPQLLAANPRLRLLLVGGGPEDKNLRQQAHQSGLDGHVIFTGRVPHAQVERYYSLIDLLVYPRLKIRLNDLVTPLKPLEAMAQGKLLLASDVGGHRELVRDGENGFLFKADDPGALADAVLRTLSKREHWPNILKAGRYFVEAERNWARSVDGYTPIYTRLAGRPDIALSAPAA